MRVAVAGRLDGQLAATHEASPPTTRKENLQGIFPP